VCVKVGIAYGNVQNFYLAIITHLMNKYFIFDKKLLGTLEMCDRLKLRLILRIPTNAPPHLKM